LVAMRKTLFLHIVFLVLVSTSVHAQNNSGVSMEISPNPVGRNDRFGITIEVPVSDASMVVVDEPQLDNNMVLLRGPYIRPVTGTGPSGEKLTRTEITYVYRCEDTGRFEIGPYRISGIDRVYTTEPQLMEVGVYRNRQLIIPLELEWRISENTAYVGQNIVSVLTALEQPEIRIFEDVTVGTPEEGFFQSAEGVGSINRLKRGGKTLYEVPVAGFMLTPSTTGRIALPQGRVNYENGQAVSDRPVLEVLPLPEEVRKSGAVGAFRLGAELEKREVGVGERTTLVVRIEGTGNLNYVDFPELQLEGFSVLQDEESSDYVPTQKGYKGVREYTYTLVAEEAGQRSVRIPSMKGINPDSDRIYSTRSFTFDVEVVSQSAETAKEEDGAGFQFTPIPMDSMGRGEITTRFATIESYLWLLPGPLLFFLFLLLTRRKLAALIPLLLLLSFGAAEFNSESVVVTIEEARQAYEDGDYSTAEILYLEGVRMRPDVPDLHYNAALSAFQKGSVGSAVLYTRTALTLEPMNTTYDAFLEYVSQEKGINTDIEPPFLFHPDFFLFLVTIFVNMAGFLGIIYLFRRKNGYFIVAAFMLFLSVVIAIGFVYSIVESNKKVGVVVIQEDSIPPVKKIPRESASNSFTLKDGEVVKIKGRAHQFYFIETGLGQKGWILKDVLKPVPRM